MRLQPFYDEEITLFLTAPSLSCSTSNHIIILILYTVILQLAMLGIEVRSLYSIFLCEGLIVLLNHPLFLLFPRWIKLDHNP